MRPSLFPRVQGLVFRVKGLGSVPIPLYPTLSLACLTLCQISSIHKTRYPQKGLFPEFHGVEASELRIWDVGV